MVNNQRDRSRERACEDYVKAIYHLNGDAPVRAAALARHLRISRATVSKSRRVLESTGLVQASRGRTDTMRLTAKGLKLAVRMIRRHRLIETFLHRKLKVPLERVHADAEKIEHAVSDDIARRLYHFLGSPTTDPHGHAIPSLSDARVARADMRLIDASPGDSVTVVALDDRDESIVKYLNERLVLPGVRATVKRRSPKSILLRIGRKDLLIANEAARSVRCSTAPKATSVGG
jgi:DtxR family transcriptional regulator, Mn-dependent transcriptional regulator